MVAANPGVPGTRPRKSKDWFFYSVEARGVWGRVYVFVCCLLYMRTRLLTDMSPGPTAVSAKAPSDGVSHDVKTVVGLNLIAQ